MTGQASSQEVADVLGRAMPEGKLKRLPRHPRRREVVLAVLSMSLVRRYPYSEPELNEQLKASLAVLDAEFDHVTCDPRHPHGGCRCHGASRVMPSQCPD